jgi:GTP pyrophosphokinase
MHDETTDMGNKMKPPWRSKGAVNRAGDAIRADTLTDEHAAIVENWRLAHRRVINTFQALLRTRARDGNVEVAQRLKRRRFFRDDALRTAADAGRERVLLDRVGLRYPAAPLP